MAYPDVMIFSPPKTGTSSLFYILGQNPAINKSVVKEVQYFSCDYNHGRGLDWYAEHWEDVEGLKMESSPNYYPSEECRDRIAEECETLKTITIARDPVQRFVSQYVHFKGMNENGMVYRNISFTGIETEADEFMEMMSPGYDFEKKQQWVEKDMLLGGVYLPGLRWVHETYGTENNLLLDYEEYNKNNQWASDTCCDFLGINRHEFQNVRVNTARLYQQKRRVIDDITQEHRDRLAEFYREHNKEFFSYTGRDFGWNA